MHNFSIHLSARIGGRVTSGKMLDEHPLLWKEWVAMPSINLPPFSTSDFSATLWSTWFSGQDGEACEKFWSWLELVMLESSSDLSNLFLEMAKHDSNWINLINAFPDCRDRYL